jgi:hypothetical protein
LGHHHPIQLSKLFFANLWQKWIDFWTLYSIDLKDWQKEY